MCWSLLISAGEPDFVREASKHGIFAYITDGEADDWRSSIDIVPRRFAEYHDLEGAFGRRATIERAKGMLRDRSRARNRKVVDIAAAVVDGHPLFPKEPPPARVE